MTATQSRTTTMLAALAAMAVAAFLTVNLSMAAFSAETPTAESSWEAGTVALSNDHTATAAFKVTNIVPGYSASKTITVSNSSSVPTNLKLRAAVAGGLADDLVVTVTKDGSAIYSGALNGMPSTYAAGVDTTDAAGATSSWVFNVSLPSSVGNEAEGDAATATFTWEARNL